MYPFMGGVAYARKDKDGSIVRLCQCDCHLGWEDNRRFTDRPDAVHNNYCEPCLNEAMSPWTNTLASLLK